MARLTIEQVQAPDFSASAELMRGAAASFDKGLESAQGILSKYNEGQQAKDDMFAIQEIAKQRDEAGLDTLLASGTLANLNLSDTMRANLANIRSDVIGNVNARDGNTRANNADGRAAAAEGRTAAEYLDSVAARAERRALTPSAVAAFNEANTTGSGNGGGVEAQVYQGLLDRGMPEHIAEGFMMNFQDESGFQPDITEGEANVHGTYGKGLYQLTGDRRDAFEAQFGNDYSIDNQLDFMMAELNTTERSAANSIFAAQDAGSAAAAIVNNFLRPAEEHAASRTAKYTGGQGWNPNQLPVTSVGTGGQAYQDFSSRVAASLYMDPADATAFLSGTLEEQRATDERIRAADDLRQATLGSEATLAAITDPNNTTAGQVQQDLIDTPGLSAANRLGLAGQNLDAYGNIIAPAVTANPQATAAAELAAADAARSNELDPTVQAFEEAAAFDKAEGGAGAALTANLGEQATGVLAPENVNRSLAQFAEENGITPGEAAVVFNSVAGGNAEQLAAQLQAASDTDIYASLSSIADNMFGDSARSAYQDGKLADVGAAAQRDAVQANILVAKTEAAKLPAGSTERADAEERIRLLEVGSIAANQPQKTKAQTAAYLGIEPSQMAELSPDDKRAAEEAIRANQDLSVEEKTLLIMGLRL
jgi:hypothetical protein